MRFVLSALLSGALFLLSSSGLAATASQNKSAFDKATLEAYIRHMLLITPGVQLTIHDPKPSPVPGLKEVGITLSFGGNTQEWTWWVSDDGKWIIQPESPQDALASVHNINRNPFEFDLEKIKTAGAPSFGKPTAPIKMVVYSDFECPNCKQFDEALRANLMKTFPDQVQFFFRDMPLVQIHPWAKDAAIAGRCIYHQNPAAFWDYHDWVYQEQSDITPDNFRAKVIAFGKSKGLDDIGLNHCLDSAATAPEVDEELAQGRSLGIDQTPTAFIDGHRMVGDVPWPNVEAVIRAELEDQKTAAAKTDEKCCEVKLPILSK